MHLFSNQLRIPGAGGGLIRILQKQDDFKTFLKITSKESWQNNN